MGAQRLWKVRLTRYSGHPVGVSSVGVVVIASLWDDTQDQEYRGLGRDRMVLQGVPVWTEVA